LYITDIYDYQPYEGMSPKVSRLSTRGRARALSVALARTLVFGLSETLPIRVYHKLHPVIGFLDIQLMPCIKYQQIPP